MCPCKLSSYYIKQTKAQTHAHANTVYVTNRSNLQQTKQAYDMHLAWPATGGKPQIVRLCPCNAIGGLNFPANTKIYKKTDELKLFIIKV